MKITENCVCVSCTPGRGEISTGWTNTKQKNSCTAQGATTIMSMEDAQDLKPKKYY